MPVEHALDRGGRRRSRAAKGRRPMIRINLLGVERQKARKAIRLRHRPAAHGRVQPDSRRPRSLGIGWWYWSLDAGSRRASTPRSPAAAAKSARLRVVLMRGAAVRSARSAAAAARALIEQLRRGQSVPVQLLDHVSRSLPDMLWLTALEQNGADRDDRGPQHHADRAVGLRRQPRDEPAAAEADRDREQPGRTVVDAAARPARRRADQVHGEGARGGRRALRGRSGRGAPRRARRRVSGQITQDTRSWRSTSVSASCRGTARSARSPRCRLPAPAAFWNFYATRAQASIDQRRGAAREAARGDRSRSADGEAAARVPPRSRRARSADRAAARRAARGAGRGRSAAPRAGDGDAVEPDDSRLHAAGRPRRSSCTWSGRSA